MNLHFCKDNESLAAKVLTSPADVMIMRTGREAPLAIKALKDGRDVLAMAHSGTATGWRAPEGTVITIDDGIDDQLAAQARARVSTGLRSYQKKAIEHMKASMEDGGKIRISAFTGRTSRPINADVLDRLEFRNPDQSVGRFHRPGQEPVQVEVMYLSAIDRQVLGRIDSKSMLNASIPDPFDTPAEPEDKPDEPHV